MISYVHRGGATPLMGKTIDQFIHEMCHVHAHREAIVSLPQAMRLTYRELYDQVQKLARGLMAIGVERGDRVAIWSTDNIEWLLVQLATAKIGAILVNINPAYKTFELEHALKLARVQHIVLVPSFRKSNYVEMLHELVPEVETSPPDRLCSERLPDLRRIAAYDPEKRESMEPPYAAFLTWRDVIERGAEVGESQMRQRSDSLDPDDPINIQFTSGTTGFPKAVMLTHHNVLNNGYFVGEAMKFTESDRLCVPVPFYHCFGMVVSNLACLTHGACIVIPAPHFEPGATLLAIDRERCTALHGVPTMFIAELDHPDFKEYDLSSLRTGIMAGAPCPPQLMHRVMNEMGCREILIAYGLTETSPVTHITRPDDSFERRTQTVGFNMPHQEVKIVDSETNAIVPIGERGEICLRGYNNMRGYFDQEEATQQTIDKQGWLHSGDLGEMDEDGYLCITGRLKDMIIRGGENIYPAEIEAFFHEHPKVANVAVFGVPDERLGEQVAVWIELHEESEATVEEFLEYAKRRIAHFKVPKHLWIVDAFPMTVTGKIQKFRMREIATKWIEEAAQSKGSASGAASR